MRKLLLILGLLLLAGSTMAQEVPTAEGYLGYTFIRINPSAKVSDFNSNGGVGSFQVNFNRNFSVLGEFSGIHKTGVDIGGLGIPLDQTQFTYLFGPRVFVNKAGRFSPFLEYLFGGVHNSRSFSVLNSVLSPGFIVPSGVTAEVGATATRFRSTQNAFAMAVGGGLDIKLSRVIAIRPAQLDYLPTHFSPLNIPGVPFTLNDVRWQHNLRYSTGVVFRFGSGVGY